MHTKFDNGVMCVACTHIVRQVTCFVNVNIYDLTKEQVE